MKDPLYEMPKGDPIVLEVAPRLASWMRRDHPDQRRLNEFLDHAESVVRSRLRTLEGPLAIRLDVALSEDVDPLQEHDLDNYLYPLVSRLGAARFVSAWGTKRRGGTSTIRVERAHATAADDEWQVRQASSGRSATSLAWKQDIQAQLRPVEALTDGPAALQLSFVVGPGRNWTNLWKQTIDTLDPILGPTLPGRDWHPRDGRVVRLGLHRATDPTAQHKVDVAVRWRLASLEWSELAWFASMSDEARERFLRAHRRRPLNEAIRSARVQDDDVRRGGLDDIGGEIARLNDLAAFRRARSSERPIVNIDKPSRRKVLHLRPSTCPWIREQWFVQKVLDYGGRYGAYYEVADEATAHIRWPGLQRCERCARS